MFKMLTSLCFTVFGYLSGSILFARVYAGLFGKDLITDSKDGNPGTSNAFIYGGMACGILTLLGDLIKGVLPVLLYLRMTRGNIDAYFAPVLAAPVLGHIFPVFYRFKGGKGIAVSFGCLLGMLPVLQPLLTLAVIYVVLSVGICVSPHYYRTIVTYTLFAAVTALYNSRFNVSVGITLGCLLISVLIIYRHLKSREAKQKFTVSFAPLQFLIRR